MRRVACRNRGTAKRERLEFLADNPHFTMRFAFYVGRRCRQASVRDVAKEPQALARAAAGRQQAPQHSLSVERGVRPALGLPARELGSAVLHQLAHRSQMAAAQALRAIRRHGVELQVAICGSFRLSVPFSYDLALCGASAEGRLGGRRLSVLIRDGVEAVAAETYPGGAEAIWSENRVFSLLCNEYAKSDIMGRCLIDALGEQAYGRLRHERPELRTMLRSEPLP